MLGIQSRSDHPNFGTGARRILQNKTVPRTKHSPMTDAQHVLDAAHEHRTTTQTSREKCRTPVCPNSNPIGVVYEGTSIGTPRRLSQDTVFACIQSDARNIIFRIIELCASGIADSLGADNNIPHTPKHPEIERGAMGLQPCEWSPQSQTCTYTHEDSGHHTTSKPRLLVPVHGRAPAGESPDVPIKRNDMKLLKRTPIHIENIAY